MRSTVAKISVPNVIDRLRSWSRGLLLVRECRGMKNPFAKRRWWLTKGNKHVADHRPSALADSWILDSKSLDLEVCFFLFKWIGTNHGSTDVYGLGTDKYRSIAIPFVPVRHCCLLFFLDPSSFHSSGWRRYVVPQVKATSTLFIQSGTNVLRRIQYKWREAG